MDIFVQYVMYFQTQVTMKFWTSRITQTRVGRIRNSGRLSCRPDVEALEPRCLLTGSVVPGLIASWNFDEGPDWHDDPFQAVASATVARDSVGLLAASLTNMDASAWVSGQQFTGLAFDGVNDFLTISGDLGMTLGGTASLLFWVKTSQVGKNDASQSPGIAGNDVIQWGGLDTTGRLGLSINNVWIARTSEPVNDNQWHCIGLTRNASTGEVSVYVDGQVSASGTGPTGTLATEITSFGRRDRTGNAAGYYTGRLDQVAMFNQALAASAIQHWGANYAPKTWDTQSEGVTGSSFSTTIVFYQAFDAEGDALRVVRFTQPAHGSVADNLDGTFQYTPAVEFIGSDQFEVTIEDGNGGFSRTTMRLKVLPPSTGESDLFATHFGDLAAVSAGGQQIDYSIAWRVPRAVDWDGDGKNDLLVAADSAVWLYHNSGTTAEPIFDAGVKVQAAGVDIVGGSFATSIALADLTGDGVADLVVSDENSQLRLFANTSPAGQVPVYAAPVILQSNGGGDLAPSNPRFDLGDWNDDGLLDIILGTYNGDVKVYLNTGTPSAPQFDPVGMTIFSEAYNYYPRWFDLSRNGISDLIRGINWGNVRYWMDPVRYGGDLSQTPTGYLSIVDSTGTVPGFQNLTDGPVVDFADFNGDGVLDIVIGGQLAGDKLFIAYGQARSFSELLSDLETIFDAHPDDLRTALDANNQQLLSQMHETLRNLINQFSAASPVEREVMYATFAAHIEKYSFLRMQALDTTKYHHIPGLVVQDILIASHLLPDTPTNRIAIADLFEMTGLRREIFLEFRYLIGENVRASTNQLESLQTFLRSHPRESYPDKVITLGHFFGDGDGGYIDSFGAAKNTYEVDTGMAVDEWADDLRNAILAVKPGNPTSGDLFTFVVGHEATHSLDAYIRSRANLDLQRRWGQFLVLAGGPDMVAGSDGWLDGYATQPVFLEKGYWDGLQEHWDAAWYAYWSTGPGAAFANENFMRGDIRFFLENPQESLATQGNQHWVDSEGRIIGAIDRYHRGFTANLTEVVTFLDFLSVGMNRLPMFDIDVNPDTGSADWKIEYANLERDDLGRITRISMSNGRDYRFLVDTAGIYSLPSESVEDALVSITGLNSSQPEGNSGLTALTFTVVRTGAAAGAASVHYAVTGSGPLMANEVDFDGANLEGDIAFEPGQTTVTLTIYVSGDAVYENDEGFTVTLSNPSAGNILSISTATGTIFNDDQPAMIVVSSTATSYLLNRKNTPLVIDAAATFTTGLVNPSLAGAKLTVSLTSNRDSRDVLELLSVTRGIHVQGKKLLDGKTVIGTVTGGKGKAADLMIQFNSAATVSRLQQTLARLTFSAKKAGTGPRTVRIRLTEFAGFDSNPATRQIVVQ